MINSQYPDSPINNRTLYKLAWAFEILAASIGIFVAYQNSQLTYTTFSNITGNNLSIFEHTQVVFAFLPALMVALAELLKIPFVYIVYTSPNYLIKLIFTILLFAVSYLTFDTLILGFEQGYSNITTRITEPKRELQKLQSSKDNSIKQKAVLEKQTTQSITSNYEKKKLLMLENIEESRKKLLNEKADLVLPDVKIKEKELDVIKNERASLVSLYDKDIKLLNEEINNSKKNNKEEVNQLDNKIESKRKDCVGVGGIFSDEDEICERQIEELENRRNNLMLGIDDTLINSKSRRIENHKIDIRRIDNKIKILSREIVISQNSNSQIKKIEEKIGQLNEKQDKALNDIDNLLEQSLKELANKEKRIEILSNTIEKFSKDEIELKDRIEKVVGQTQLYRIAKRLYGKEQAADVTQKQADFVAMIWFGGIAFVVSILGMFLAFGAFHMANAEKKSMKNKNNLSLSLRLALRALRKRWKEPKIVKVTNTIEKEIPKEVIKEVPVEKVVIKEVEKEVPVDKVSIKEVPVEVVSKEIIYTPLWTNDPDRLKFGKTKVENITSEKEDEEDK